MAKLPPQPLGVAPGSSYWNDWYEKLRTFVDQITTSVDWSIITGKPTTLAGYGITDAQPLDIDLTALAALATTGVVVRTGSGTATTRTITGTANRVVVTNGDGVAGPPTLDVGTNIMTTNTAQTATAIKTWADNALFRSTVAMSNGAAAAAGTLGNAPVAGNPTKWLAVDDNGTIRWVPSW